MNITDDDLMRLHKYSVLIDKLRDAYEAQEFETLSVSVKTQSLLKDLLFAEDSPAGVKGWPRNFLNKHYVNEMPASEEPRRKVRAIKSFYHFNPLESNS